MTSAITPLSEVFSYSGDPSSTDVLFRHPHSPRVCIFADTLGWAAAHNIPLPDALRSLPFTSESELRTSLPTSVLQWMLRPLLALYAPHVYFNTRWSAKVKGLREDLEHGHPLATGLRHHFQGILPEFYLVGVERSESHGTLPSALNLLAEQMRHPYDLAAKCRQLHTFTIARMIGTSYVLIFALINVVPKLDMIFEDLLGTSPIAPLNPFFQMLTTILGFFILIMLAPFFLLKLGRFGEDLLQRVPLLGRYMRKIMLADFARSMAVFLSQGDDLVEATEWSQDTARSFWMQKATQSFLNAIENGTEWSKAWIELAPGSGLNDWIISSAAAREDPASGFALLADWAHEDLAASARRLNLWLEPIATLLMGSLVFLLAYTTLHALNSVIFAMT